MRLKGGSSDALCLPLQYASLMVDWVVSCRVNESCYVGILTRRGLTLEKGAMLPCLPLKPQAVLVWHAWAMLKEVDCLPMVTPDAASHLGIRHVRTCTF